MRSWEEAKQEHLAEVLKKYNIQNIVGIFAYGSQNYNSDTENSDWDTKVIYVPSFEDLALSSPVSETLELSNGEHCEIKDIREMVKMFKKQNINFTEILFTKYNWVNPQYESEWKIVTKYKEIIIRYNPNIAVQSICGQILHTLKQNPEDGKKIANAYRLTLFLVKYLDGFNYEDCITLSSEEREEFLSIKYKQYSETRLQSYVNIVKNTVNILKNTSYPIDLEANEFINNILFKQFQLRIIARNIPTTIDFL